jgi:hypothetical protein
MVSNKPSKLDERELREAAPHPVLAEELWLGASALTAPMAWALHLVLNYGMIYPAERWQSKAVLYGVSLVGVLAALVSLLLGRRRLHRAQRAHDGEETQRERSLFLAICACAVGVFFLLAIIAQTVPAVMLPLGVQ